MSEWRTLLEHIIDDLIESGNGNVDLAETTDKTLELRARLNEEFSQRSDQMSENKTGSFVSIFEGASRQAETHDSMLRRAMAALDEKTSGQVNVKVKRLSPDATLPTYATDGAAAFDLYAAQDVVIESGATEKVPLGLAFEVPAGYVMFIVPRSGVSFRTNLRQSNGIGVIDSDFRGETAMLLENNNRDVDVGEDVLIDINGKPVNAIDYFGAWDSFGKGSYLVRKGDRVCQAWVQPVPTATFTEVDELDETQRGAGGFGHTGTNAKAQIDSVLRKADEINEGGR